MVCVLNLMHNYCFRVQKSLKNIQVYDPYRTHLKQTIWNLVKQAPTTGHANILLKQTTEELGTLHLKNNFKII